MDDVVFLKIVSAVGFLSVAFIVLLSFTSKKYADQIREKMRPASREYGLIKPGYLFFGAIPLAFLVIFIPNGDGIGKTIGWMLLALTGMGILLIVWQRWIEPLALPFVDLLPIDPRYSVEKGYSLHWIRLMKGLGLFYRIIKFGLMIAIPILLLSGDPRNPLEYLFDSRNQKFFLAIATAVAFIAARYFFRKLM